AAWATPIVYPTARGTANPVRRRARPHARGPPPWRAMPDPPTLGAMTTTSIAPLGPATWDDVPRIFAGGGDGPSCQCRWPMMRQVDFSRATQEELAQAFREELDHSPAPGLVLSIDAEPA